VRRVKVRVEIRVEARIKVVEIHIGVVSWIVQIDVGIECSTVHI